MDVCVRWYEFWLFCCWLGWNWYIVLNSLVCDSECLLFCFRWWSCYLVLLLVLLDVCCWWLWIVSCCRVNWWCFWFFSLMVNRCGCDVNFLWYVLFGCLCCERLDGSWSLVGLCVFVRWEEVWLVRWVLLVDFLVDV